MSRTRPASLVNRLLEPLPTNDRRRLLAKCEPVELVFGEVLHQPDQVIRHVYFPIGGFISQITPIDESECLEVGLIGNEGMFGIPLALGVDTSPMRAVVQGAGCALRMAAAPFRSELERSKALRREIERYVFVQLSQFAQMIGCTRFHVVEERLARWLLMTQDRAHAHTFHVTHEFLAFMLGVRRVGVTRAASALQERGLIHYVRGNLTVLDRRGLKGASCGCYNADRQSYARIFAA